MSNWNHISLFAGQGGNDLGAEWMGWNNIAHCEKNDFCLKILKYYWPNAKTHTDIKTTDFNVYRGHADVVTCGFPCQAFSTAGKQRGIEDERYLWPEGFRAIREIKPPFALVENVTGLISWGDGLVFEQVQADMESEGFEVIPFVLPAAGIEAPHGRHRIWFVAYSHRNDAERRRYGQTGQTQGEMQGIQKEWKWLWPFIKRISTKELITDRSDAGTENMRRERKNTVLGCQTAAHTRSRNGWGLRGYGARPRGTKAKYSEYRNTCSSWPATYVYNINGWSESPIRLRPEGPWCKPCWENKGFGADEHADQAGRKEFNLPDFAAKSGQRSGRCDEPFVNANKIGLERLESLPARENPIIRTDWSEFPTVPPIRTRNDGFSRRLVRFVENDFYGTISERNRIKNLPEVWKRIQSPKVWENVRRFYSLECQDVLLQTVQLYSTERGEQGKLSPFSEDFSKPFMQKLRKYGEFRCTPQGRKLEEQRSKQFGNTMSYLPHEVALAAKEFEKALIRYDINHRNQSIMSAGNSVVPQLVYRIFKAIKAFKELQA